MRSFLMTDICSRWGGPSSLLYVLSVRLSKWIGYSKKRVSYNDSETIVDQGHQQVKFCTSLNSFDAVVVKKVMVKPQKWPLFLVRKTWPSYPTSTLSYSRFCWASFCLHLGLDLEITKLSISGSSSIVYNRRRECMERRKREKKEGTKFKQTCG